MICRLRFAQTLVDSTRGEARDIVRRQHAEENEKTEFVQPELAHRKVVKKVYCSHSLSANSLSEVAQREIFSVKKRMDMRELLSVVHSPGPRRGKYQNEFLSSGRMEHCPHNYTEPQ